MRKTALILSLSVFTTAAQAKMGFYSAVDLATTPKSVLSSIGSIFQVIFPSDAVGTYEITSAEEAKRFAESLDSNNKIVEAGQIRFCIRENLKTCVLFSNFNQGTAFLVGDGRTLVTARHNAEAYIDGLRKYNPEQLKSNVDLQIPMILKTSDGKLINLKSNKRRVRHLDIKNGAAINTLEGLDYMSSDSLVFEFESSLGPGLPISSQALIPHQTIRIIGYPGMTLDRQKDHGKPDSPGKKLVYSEGQVFATLDALTRLQVMMSPIRQMRELISSNPKAQKLIDPVVFADADSAEGISGAPIVDLMGNVVGILSGDLREYRGIKPSLVFSFGIRIDQIRD